MPQLAILENNFTIRCQLQEPRAVTLCYHFENPRGVVDAVAISPTGAVACDEHLWSLAGLTVGHLKELVIMWHMQQERHKTL